MPDDMNQDAIRKVMEAVNELRSTVDENEKKRDAVLEDKTNRINEFLDKFEDQNAKLTKVQAEARAAAEELQESVNERIDGLETKLNRPSAGSDDPRAQKKLWQNWARAALNAATQGEVNLNDDQRAALTEVKKQHASLSVGNDTTGGYLAPVEMVQEIIKGVTEISPVRSLVRVRPTGMKSLVLPKRTGQFAAQRVAEQGTRSETTGLTFGQNEIPMPEAYALIDISEQNLEDSMFDLEAFIREEAAEQFMLLEGTEVVTGSGVNSCEGFMTNADVGTTNSGNATAVTADGLIDLKHAIKTAYTANGTFVMNRTTLGAVRKMKGGDGNYLWQSGIAAGKPNTIDGDPYVELPDMPNQNAGAKPVAYGDFRRAYVLGERLMATFLRDPYKQATSGNIRMIFRKRFGGNVVLAEAIRTLTCSA